MTKLFLKYSWHINRSLVLITLVLAGNASADSDYTLMVYGDSLSAGYGLEESQDWVTLLSSKLTRENFDYAVINASVSGETTTGGLSRLPAMLDSYEPDLFILELGGNDGLRGIPLRNIRENLQAIIKLAQSSGAEVVLVGIQIPPNYGPRYTKPFFQQYADIATEMNLPLVPFLIDGIPQQPELMQDDGIHPKAEAQGMILDNVWPILQPILEE
ncbi:MAG: arylesterase [Gammaproteobacteria bacterium]|nr:arylesterase [Gammaproteobacteria bacterium]